MHICDLHTHSTASDGQYTPTQLVQMAVAQNLDALAITDHDTIDGLSEAIQAGEKFGLRVIPGIELSAKEYPTFHILGYNFSINSPTMEDFCQKMRRCRSGRNERLLLFLRSKGVKLSLSAVEKQAKGTILGRPHFAQAMVCRGYVSTIREAFDRYLDTVEYHEEVERGNPSVQECIQAIKASDGKVSLAHPYQIGISNSELEKLVINLSTFGLDAIECYYSSYSSEQQAFYLHLAKKYRLNCSGGSDFHGEKVKPGIMMAALNLNLDWLSAFD